ncbi:DMT family transporter [Salipiger sp. P9]|uniref:DMT family transporter n=1 Tax=Salipiger pentaromativorans TaxID=2943193 RepID=UPI002157F4F1|nr:DMT family transporter [Salipiger pentaromativorans]MCR8548306.1 DMT family transporter [Salipiger pentaromativorans]
MRLFLLTALTMLAFAANSLLNRAALASGGIDAVSFGTLRLLAGALMLGALVLLRHGALRLGGRGRLAGVAGLFLYIYGFSAAYAGLPAGLGALLLFGMVQVTMFGGSLLGGEWVPPRRWLGAGLAFGGLIWLLWPGGGAAPSLSHAVAMIVAGIGWGIYSLAGRQAEVPLVSAAANMVLTAALGVIVLLGFALGGAVEGGWTPEAVALAVLSGAMTSGLGYALWYALLPRIPGTVAAVAQLTVPVIAMAGGMLFLGEVLTMRFVLAAALVLGGVAVSVVPLRRR